MMGKPNDKTLSRFLSLILRHKPEVVGLELDNSGWVKTNELIKAVKSHGKEIDLGKLKHIVDTNDKRRFEFNSDESKIRAAQGHSVFVDLGLGKVQPPNVLYHGTVGKYLDSIYFNGLKKMKRTHVHLSDNIATAKNVGSRRGEPVILHIDSKQMFEDGCEFYLSTNGVYLTEYVDPKYITN